MCEECVTHNELNAHESYIKIDFLLLARTLLPVYFAQSKTMVLVNTVRFQGKLSDFFKALRTNILPVYFAQSTTMALVNAVRFQGKLSDFFKALRTNITEARKDNGTQHIYTH